MSLATSMAEGLNLRAFRLNLELSRAFFNKPTLSGGQIFTCMRVMIEL